MQNDVKLNTIIVVDDIYTTGATLDAMAKVCKEAGVEDVYALTVAVGNGL
jgi:predicted amidophosphoribosyltransferase